jgi:succinoglycan biosynthesis transport protein ExoP
MDEPQNIAELHNNMVDLRSLIKIVKKRFLLITVVAMLMLLIVALVSFFVLPPIYEAKTTVLVTNAAQSLPSSNQKDDFNSFLKGISSITVTMNSCIQKIKSEILLLRIIEKLSLRERGYTTRSLTKQVFVESPKDSNILSIMVRDKDPQLALAIANGLSHELIVLNREKNLELMDQSIQAIAKQVELVNQRLIEAATENETEIFTKTLAFLKEKSIQANIARSIESESSEFVVFSPAQYPYQPVKPNKVLNMVIA